MGNSITVVNTNIIREPLVSSGSLIYCLPRRGPGSASLNLFFTLIVDVGNRTNINRVTSILIVGRYPVLSFLSYLPGADLRASIFQFYILLNEE